jgi:hypothetical protein
MMLSKTPAGKFVFFLICFFFAKKELHLPPPKEPASRLSCPIPVPCRYLLIKNIKNKRMIN